MITFLKIFAYIGIAIMLAMFVFAVAYCDWEKCYYPERLSATDPKYPYYYRVTLPWRTWQFRKTILHGWYMRIPGLYYDHASGHIYFYVWRDERYL